MQVNKKLAIAGAVAAVAVSAGTATLITRETQGPTAPKSLINVLGRSLQSSPQPLGGVYLSVPSAAYVRLLPNCVWSNGTHSITLSRHVNQVINLVNMATVPRRFYTLIPDAIGPTPQWKMPPKTSVSLLWKIPVKVKITTCSDTTTLTINVS